MAGALQGCNRPILPLNWLHPTLPDVEHGYFRIIFNNLGSWNDCSLQRKSWEGRVRRRRAEMFVLEEGTECTLYIASGCDSFPSTVPLTPALTHLTWKRVQGLMTLRVTNIVTKGRQTIQISILLASSHTVTYSCSVHLEKKGEIIGCLLKVWISLWAKEGTYNHFTIFMCKCVRIHGLCV